MNRDPLNPLRAFAFWLHLLSVPFLLLVHCVLLSTVASAQQPNVVVIYADDMGWTGWQQDDRFNPNGSVVYETPNLVELAKSGVSFNNAYAASPVCSSSRGALLTGLSPAKNRMTDWFEGSALPGENVRRPEGWLQNLPSSQFTLAEAMQQDGYNTATIGKWHLAKAPFLQGADPVALDPTNHGFDINIGGDYRGGIGHGPLGVDGYFAGDAGHWGLPGLDQPGTYEPGTYLPDVLRDEAGTFIENSVRSDEPFFLMMSEFLVHLPLGAPEDKVQKYEQKIAELQNQGVNLRGHVDPTYAAMTEVLDDTVGALMNRLHDPNGDGDFSDSVRDNTIVLFTSDNGGSTYQNTTSNAPLRHGKGSLYEGGVRVPLIASWPDVLPSVPAIKGSVVDSIVSGYDIYPTILELTGVPGNEAQNESMDGQSFASVLSAQEDPTRAAFFHYPHLSPQSGEASQNPVEGGGFVSAVRQGDWKLIWSYDDEEYELYDVDSDPGEAMNLRSVNPTVAHELSEMLIEYLETSDAQMPLDRFTGQPVPLPASLSAIVSVPEPNSSSMLLWIATIFGCIARRRSRHAK